MRLKIFTIITSAIILLSQVIQAQTTCSVMPTSGTTTIGLAAGVVVNGYYPGTGTSCAAGATSSTVGAINTAGNTTQLVAGDLVMVMQMQGADINTTNTDAYGDGVGAAAVGTFPNAAGYLTNANLQVGFYEYANVASVVLTGGLVTTVNFSSPLKYGYCNQNYTATLNIKRYQIIKVPKYFDLTISNLVTGAPWDGTSGGVIALNVENTLNITATGIVDMNGKGFRGGGGINYSGNNAFLNTDVRTFSTSTLNSSKAEGIAGTPRFIYNSSTGVATDNTLEGYINGSFGRGAPGNAGAGSTDGDPASNSHNAGGGGGANGGNGGKGGNSWSSNIAVGGDGGRPFTQNGLSRLVMGGGGGAGNANNSLTTDLPEISGANGGGIIILKARSFTGTGTVRTNGANGIGIQQGEGNTDGGGGGGAGGSVSLLSTFACSGNVGYTITAIGGNGGNANAFRQHGPGGGGSGGIVISSCAITTAPTLTGGIPGITRDVDETTIINYGATSGGGGAANTGFGPIATTIVGNVPTNACGAVIVSNPPVTNNITAPPMASSNGSTNIPLLTGTDADGSVTGYTVTSIPTAAQGVLTVLIGGVRTPVTAGQVLTPAQAATLQFDPAQGFTGNATFGFNATDNSGLVSSNSTYTIPVTNTAPVATSLQNTAVTNTSSNTAVQPLTGTDADGSIVSFTIATIPPASSGVYFYNNGGVQTALTAGTVLTAAQAATLSFTPAAGFVGNAAITYNATDNNGLSSTAPATYTTPVVAAGTIAPNYPPVSQNIVAPSIPNTPPASPLPGLVSTDQDGTIASYTINTIPLASQGILGILVGGVFTPISAGQSLTPAQMATLAFDPAGTFNGGNVQFTYSATDNSSNVSNIATYTIPVSSTPPVANPTTTPAMSNANAATSIPTLSGSDLEGPISNFTLTSIPSAASGTLFINGVAAVVGQSVPVGATLTFDPAAGFTGNAVFNYTATDGNGNVSAVAPYTIPVVTPNNPGLPTTGTPPVAGAVTATPMPSTNGPTSITGLVGSDAQTASASLTYLINSIPLASQGVLTAVIGGVVTPITANTVLTAAQAATLAFDPAVGFEGNVNFGYSVVDTDGNTSQPATYTIPVTDPAPTANNVIAPAIINTNTTPTAIPALSGSDNGVANNTTIISYNLTTVPPISQGTLTAVIGGVVTVITNATVLTPAQAATLAFTPNLSYSGTAYVFNYTTTDNLGQVSSPAAYTIPLTNIQIPPVANNVTAPIMNNSNASTAIPALSGADADGTIANFIISTIPLASQGVLSVLINGVRVPVTAGQVLTPAQAATLQFDPAATFTGTATFTYIATDNNGLTSNTATYGIPVNNTAPTANNVLNTIMNNNQSNVPVQPLSGADADGTIVGYTITSVPNPATQGTYTYLNGGVRTPITLGTVLTPAQAATMQLTAVPGFVGNLVMNYTATDNNGNVSAQANYTTPVKAPASPTPNNAPLSQNVVAPAMSNTNASTPIPNLVSSDVDGTIATYNVTAPPATQGVLSYVNGSGIRVNIAAGTTVLGLTPAQMATLQFDPIPTFTGNASFTYTAVDNSGNTSNIATYTIPVTNNPPTANAVVNPPVANTSGPIAVGALSGSDADGTIASFTIATVPPASAGVYTYVNAGVTTTVTAGTVLTPAQAATLQFDPAAGFTGNAVLTYTATDNNGIVSSPANYINPVVVAGSPVLPSNISPNANPVRDGVFGNTTGAQLIQPLTGSDADGTVANFVINSIPPASQGVLTYILNGVSTPVMANTILTPAQAATISFNPNPSYYGLVIFNYSAVDNVGNVSAVAPYTIIVNDPPPVANNTIVATPIIKASATPTSIPALSGSDNGTIVSYNITNMPTTAQGTVTAVIGGVVTTLTTGMSLTPAQAATLQFTPNPSYTGTSFVFNFNSVDNIGSVSNNATYTIPLSGGTVLPVSILNFGAQALSGKVLLTWSTAQESNVKYYLVETSIDGINFSTIGQVNANIASYNNSYSFTHNNPLPNGYNHYRLRIIDKNELVKYSTIKIVNFKGSETVQVFPNPAVSDVNIVIPPSFVGKQICIQVLSNAGQVVLNSNYNQAPAMIRINVANLSAGIYIIKVNSKNNVVTALPIKVK